MARVVERERDLRVRSSWQEPGAHKNLEAVADPQEEPSSLMKPSEHIAQCRRESGGEDTPRTQVVSVGEATWDRQDLDLVQESWRLNEPPDVPRLHDGPG